MHQGPGFLYLQHQMHYTDLIPKSRVPVSTAVDRSSELETCADCGPDSRATRAAHHISGLLDLGWDVGKDSELLAPKWFFTGQ